MATTTTTTTAAIDKEADNDAARARTTPPPATGNNVAVRRALSQTPAIARIGSTTLHTPQLQHCHVQHVSVDTEHPLEHFTVTFDEDELTLTTVTLLGKGGFGKVYAARSDSGEWYALKVSAKPMRESDWRRLKEEVALMAHFASHPNIVRLYTAGRDADRAYVVMERCAGRSLHDIVAYHNLTMDEILWIGWSLVHTVAYIHSKGCIHRDIKPQNLLFDDEGNLKLTDFGLSSRISDAQPRTTVAGTAMYMAPEMAREVHHRLTRTRDAQTALSYGKEVDTWSIGVVLYVLLTRTNPYLAAIERAAATSHGEREHKTLALFHAVANASWSWPPDGAHDSALHTLVERMLHPDRARRATLQEVQESPVWNRCPRCCPLTLLQKLSLLERAPLPRACAAQRHDRAADEDDGDGYKRDKEAAAAAAAREQHAAHTGDDDENVPPPSPSSSSLARKPAQMADRRVEALPPVAVGGRRTVDAAVAQAIASLVAAEQHARTRVALEHQQTLCVLAQLDAVLRGEAAHRRALAQRAAVEWATLCDAAAAAAPPLLSSASHDTAAHRRTHAPQRRSSSVALVTSTATTTTTTTTHAADADAATIVRADAERFAIVYPGRDSATRWHLRAVVSLPRDVSTALEQDIRCINRHVMTKLTAMPHGYNGFDCNVCDRGIVTITADKPAFRCYKCDYDVCMKCAYAGRCRDVNFVCVSCAKRFTTATKLRAHSLRCRGPSASPSPQRSSRMDTLLWARTPPPSLLDVRLPPTHADDDGGGGDTAKRPAAAAARRGVRSRSRSSSSGSSGRGSYGQRRSGGGNSGIADHRRHSRGDADGKTNMGSSRSVSQRRRRRHSIESDDTAACSRASATRATYVRTSTGARITVGGGSGADGSVSSSDDVGALVLSHRTADFGTAVAVAAAAAAQARRGDAGGDDTHDGDDGSRRHDSRCRSSSRSCRHDDRQTRRAASAAANMTATPRGSLHLDLPPQVTPPPSAELRARDKPQLRSSAELHELLMQVSSMTTATTTTTTRSSSRSDAAPGGGGSPHNNGDRSSSNVHTQSSAMAAPSALLGADASPPQYNDRGVIIGIAARRRAESVEAALRATPTHSNSNNSNNSNNNDDERRRNAAAVATTVAIRATVADKPLEHARQPRVPRSVSASRAQYAHTHASAHDVHTQRSHDNNNSNNNVNNNNNSAHHLAVKRPRDVDDDVVRAAAAHDSQHRDNDRRPPLPLAPVRAHDAHHAWTPTPPRARSRSVMTPQGGPPLPRRGPAAAQSSPPPPPPPLAALSTPQQQHGVVAPAPPRVPLPTPAWTTTTTTAVVPHGHASAAPPPPPPSSSTGGGAFLALPREQQHRQQFLDDFLSGAWVRLYSFTNEDTVVLYYCLQPGRYGAMFPTEAGVGTAVVDVYSKLVLYVPCMNNESTSRRQPHPHVQTFYDEEARILSYGEAQRYLGDVLSCITHFVKEVAQLRSEGLTPAAVHAAYIHQRHTPSVPRDTKFVYIRKVFPDPAGAFTLFRLSNLRSHVVCSAMVDIRWQSDRRHNVGQKYYVHADGTAEPFVHDHTGILSQVEMVLNNNYRR